VANEDSRVKNRAREATPLVEYQGEIPNKEGLLYIARSWGRLADDGLWEGWIEFTPVTGGEVLVTSRETEQPNLADLEYWASGLTVTYLEGALARAQ
jgi:hypothetical protein